jgi:hypothetical protein
MNGVGSQINDSIFINKRCWLAGRFGFGFGFLIGTSTKEPFDERRPAFVVVTFCLIERRRLIASFVYYCLPVGKPNESSTSQHKCEGSLKGTDFD